MEPRIEPPAGGFATRAVHAAATPQVAQRPASPPIHPSTTWQVDRSEDLAGLLEDDIEGYVYGRYDNPTNSALHGQVASLHGAEAAWSFASGMAAILATVEVLRRSGRILATDRLYGGTYALFRRNVERSGWEVDTVDLSDPASIDRHATDEHTLVYVETIANPTTRIADLEGLARRCADRGLALVVDNTFASPWLCRPIELGATAVVESATKHLGGHNDVVAGVLAGSLDLVREVRSQSYETGASLGPFEAWIVSRGVQTLSLRMERSCSNARTIARALDADGRVGTVHHPSLPSHPDHELAVEQFGGRGAGAIVAFDLEDRDRARAFADACSVFARAASLGGTRSLVIHSASTTHRQLDDAALRAAGIGPGLVRLSVGIEDVDDLLADLDDALGKITEERP
ncbi:MAG: aminotransferase class I/II-fold pyridoxal phosphate-dependent enzyme [Actinobacteria bacterium]|nr:aminotransferase class I/II-fold pyridoxal phosphate-dependent enzyme [Actinomycetota bacterium]